MAITYTQADLDALKDILLTGAGSVAIGDRRVDYRSQEQIKQLIAEVSAALNGDSLTESPKLIKSTYSRGERS